MTASGENTSTPAGEGAVSFDSALAAGSAAVTRVRIPLRGDLMDEIQQLEQHLAQVRIEDEWSNEPDRAPEVAKRIIELVEQARAAEVEFVFRSMGRRAYRAFAAEHPPTDEQAETGADFNTETFPPAVMARCCVSPTGATAEKFAELRDGDLIGDEQWNELWTKVRAANTGGSSIPLPVAAFALVRGTSSS